MKFQITFKTPDVVEDTIRKELLEKGLDVDSEAHFANQEAMTDVTDKFVGWGESVTIEFDTDKKTAVVVPIR